MKLLTLISKSAEGRITVATATMWALFLWLIPWAALALAGAVLIGTLCLSVTRVICALAGSPYPERTEVDGESFVSIHIATYSEPSEVVKRTLDSLATLGHPNYEVIVLDNNTPDPALYEPVRRHCERLGKRFRFYHFDQVEGAKAGALNIALDLTDPRADYILVLDADYQAEPGLLEQGLSYFVDSEVALVQFPQAYRNSSRDCGLTWEYRLFFDVYMRLANRLNTVLSTGTAAFVQKDALRKSGGWSGETLTEDAELGLRLHRHGYRAVYVPRIKAAGLMPTDLKNLRSQRRRWVLGNAQSIRGLLKEEGISPLRRAAMLLQLTAWASPLLFCLVPFLMAVATYTVSGTLVAAAVATVTALSTVIYLVGLLAFFLLGVTRNGGRWTTGLKAFLVHIGMLREASLSWCEIFVKSDKSFVRTDKSIHSAESDAMAYSLALSVASGLFSAGTLALGGSPFLAFIASIGAIFMLGNGYLHWNLYQIRHRTLNLADFGPAKREPAALPDNIGSKYAVPSLTGGFHG